MSDSKEMTVAEAQPPQQVALTVQERAVIALGGTERENELKALAQKYADITEVKNKAGRQQVHGAAMELANQRVATKKTGEVAREDAVALQKAVIERQKYLIGLTEPEEKRLIALRDAWDEAEAAEKAAKLAAEQKRIADIRSRIDAFRNAPAEMIGKSAQEIGVCADHLSEFVIDLPTFMELAGEAQIERNHAVTKLREMQGAQRAIEAEQARLAEERAMFERERKEAAERDRQAEASRLEQEAKDRAERDRKDAIQKRIAGIRAIVSMQAGKSSASIESAISALQAADTTGFDEFASEAADAFSVALAQLRDMHMSMVAHEAQQAELRRQQEQLAAAQAEQERREREAREVAEAKAAADKLEADHVEALAENERIDRERTEAKRLADEAHAVEQERIRRAQAEFEATGPEDWEIAQVVADHYDVSVDVARHWLARHVWMEKAA